MGDIKSKNYFTCKPLLMQLLTNFLINEVNWFCFFSSFLGSLLAWKE